MSTSNDRQQREHCNIESWEATLALFNESLTTLHGARLSSVVRLIGVAKERGWNRAYYASQSHGRLVISSTGNDQSEPYLMVSVANNDGFICELYVPGEDGPTLSKEFRCSQTAANDVIASNLQLLSRSKKTA